MPSEPEQLAERPHWGRFPIPFVTAVDELGKPDFRVHDDRRRLDCALHRLCQLCGKALILDRTVFVSQQPRKLVFGEPPMHEQCFEFAWTVCPWLAGGNWRDELRTAARDLMILPAEPDTGDLTILWVADASSWRCQSDPAREGGWIWVVEPTYYGGPVTQPHVTWAETRSRERR